MTLVWALAVAAAVLVVAAFYGNSFTGGFYDGR
jgi:hypothetical protein